MIYLATVIFVRLQVIAEVMQIIVDVRWDGKIL